MRPEKKAIVDELRSHVENKHFLILTEYRGLKVSQTSDLRNRLRDVSAEYHVVQNRMVKQVADDLDAGLKGPTAVISGDGDVVEVAKVLKAFIKENELPTIKIGRLEGVIVSAADIEKLATLPSRHILLGQAVGTIAAPLSQFVGVMNQKLCSLLYALNAVKEKKENG
ncbi:MAG: 50S ribosomal protein L10 [Verrucomicrobia bacterium]|nr:50S ribosomal protein L10 [Verrucomicrobiota bacterium]